jgi:hypothetical protein
VGEVTGEFETGPEEPGELTIHGYDGSESTLRIGPQYKMMRADPVVVRNDLVLEWDVEDGGWLGAVISCRFCTGTGRIPEDHGNGLVEWLGCPDCSGSGKLHRPYAAGDPAPPPEPEPDDGPAAIIGGSWSGAGLTRFAYLLAGALATVMLPADREMPTEAIDEMIRRVMAEGSRAVTDPGDGD